VPVLSDGQPLTGITGAVPQPGKRPAGCVFAARCADAADECLVGRPPLEELPGGRFVRCVRHAALASRVAPPGRPRALQAAKSPTPLVRARGISASYGDRQVLFDVELTVHASESIALVGESGSGKTTLARCLVGLHRRFTGEVLLGEKPLAATARARDRAERRAVQYVFQSPYTSLNPRKTVAQLVGQPLRLFFDLDRREVERQVVAALDWVRLDPALLTRYPYELSGGERQRVAIARSLVVKPSLLVCDEVTSALDVSVQAAIVELLAELRRKMDLGLLFVTHDLALVRTVASDVAVMHGGRIVEAGPVESVLAAPAHEYTKALLADTPTLVAGGSPR
jgi:peptide/nickel transport system ATP-binding protein